MPSQDSSTVFRTSSPSSSNRPAHPLILHRFLLRLRSPCLSRRHGTLQAAARKAAVRKAAGSTSLVVVVRMRPAADIGPVDLARRTVLADMDPADPDRRNSLVAEVVGCRVPFG